MTGLLTDDVRREHYPVLQEERIRCEKQFDRCGTDRQERRIRMIRK